MLNMILQKLLQLLGISVRRVTPTNITMHGFNTNDSHSLDKIKL